ncbi:BAG family molecular chaperone regulator 3 [Hibiscus syriacus]|uniref:BAG family molecular chaperone regulator 3 n=1 Tax=Hibiscus syriacus TaxID=106335 RepID=A0A6A3B0J6_HIBSY|nr:BAG family molecular chaperone regulator 1-like [Hibiscus syriacus]KAE8709703.1 BAG family molecular chaperone regulator 3 [Hibiscus syriacus]
MMRMKTKATGQFPVTNRGGSSFSGGGEPVAQDWELRPGGMLVQKESGRNSVPPPTIRVRVKYRSIYHEINISSQATFGELKKMLTGPTGLHHQDQKLLYKDKERDSNAFLDMAGVKDKSKLVLIEDPISQEKRILETRKNAKMEKASKSISEISLEVDRLASQVSTLETIIYKGGKVAEKYVISLIEQLMNQLLKLDGIMADGDVKLQRKMQVRRVQKYVETLDMLKIKTAMPNTNGGQTETQNQNKHSNARKLAPVQEQQSRRFNGQKLAPVQQQQSSNSVAHLPVHQQYQQQQQQSASGSVVFTTKWETFDSSPLYTSTSTANNSAPPKFPWDFD